MVDCQYTDEKHPSRCGWGHNSLLTVADLCAQVRPRMVSLCHHYLQRSDQQLTEMVERLDQQLKQWDVDDVFVFAAGKGLTLRVAQPNILRPTRFFHHWPLYSLSMDCEFSDKTVLVTGTAGDIGRRLADRLLGLNANVFQTDIRHVDTPNFTPGDVSDPEFVRAWIDGTVRSANRIDALINVAGICPRTSLADITPLEWDEVLKINLRSTFLLSQAAIEIMIAQRDGAIVNLASLAGKVGGIAVGAHYSASKAAIGSFTKTLARYGAPHGVRANAVAPGLIDTAMTSDAGPDAVQELQQLIPLRRLGRIDEVIEPILFLASSRAAYITGATLDVNGGILMD